MKVSELRTVLNAMDGELDVVLRLTIGNYSDIYLGDATNAEADAGCTDTVVCLIDGSDEQ